MSIAAMVDNEVAKGGRRPPVTGLRSRRAGRRVDRAQEDSATRTSDVVSALVSYVPAEAIAAYLILLPFMDPSSADKTGPDSSYSGRWGLAIGIAVFSVLYALGYRKIAAVQTNQKFTVPWIPLSTTLLAFAAWVFAIPNSPFNDFGFYTPELGGAVGSVAATVISFVGAVTGETLTWAETEGN